MQNSKWLKHVMNMYQMLNLKSRTALTEDRVRTHTLAYTHSQYDLLCQHTRSSKKWIGLYNSLLKKKYNPRELWRIIEPENTNIIRKTRITKRNENNKKFLLFEQYSQIQRSLHNLKTLDNSYCMAALPFFFQTWNYKYYTDKYINLNTFF